MKQSLTLWAIALAITLASAAYQRRTGPTYPLSGTTEIGGQKLKYKLERTHGGDDDAQVRIPAGLPSLKGTVSFRKTGTSDSWTTVEFDRKGAELIASLPHQPPAGKIDYKVMLRSGEEMVWLNGGRPATMRFKGDVPVWVLAPHVVCMFLSFLLAARAGLGAATGRDEARLALAACLLITVGGMILGPVVQKLAFGAAWTGWPLGPDLTDNKTAVAWLAWVLAVWKRRPRWIIGAALVTFAVFLIPHSVLSGNEPVK
jgi:hypothetical protein